MNKEINVLVFPAGSESALDIYEALRFNVNIKVYGISGKKDNSEFTFHRNNFKLGNFYINEKGFYEILNSIIDEWKIDIIIPTHDTIALELAKNKDRINSRVLVSEYRTADICRYKSKTYHLFRDCWFCPKIYTSPDQIKDSDYPVFIKPDVGAGGKGSRLIENASDFLNIDIGKYVICENLPGDEYTIDCFTSKDGILKFCGVRIRERIQMGIAFRSSTLPATKEFECAANEINKRLKFMGAWFFQMKRDKSGSLKLMEVSCRQAGTMTLHRHKGINFPLLGIFELLGTDTKIIENKFNLTMDRYLKGAFKSDINYNVVYIDFDDTITTNGKLNIQIMSFLYQCVNNNKRIILLTRHKENIYITLKKYKLDSSLFDEIIDIPKNINKSQYITEKKAIFIDNSFAERDDVYQNCDIPVFDVDCIDILIDKYII